MAPVCHFLCRKPEALRIMEVSLEMHSSGGVESTGKFVAKQTTWRTLEDGLLLMFVFTNLSSRQL